MLLFEAKAEIDSRLSELLKADYAKHIPEFFEALEMASKALDAQMRLMDILNDLNNSPLNENDSFSFNCMMETLNEIRFDWEEEE